MLFMDMPNVPPAQAVLIAQAKAELPIASELYGTVGVCTLRNNQIKSEKNIHEIHSLGPRAHADSIFTFKPLAEEVFGYETAEVTVLQGPEHGTLNEYNDYNYYPTPGYVGNDKVIFLVNIEGYKIKVISFIKVLGGDVDPGLLYQKYCPKENPWKISSSAEILSKTSLTVNFYKSMWW